MTTATSDRPAEGPAPVASRVARPTNSFVAVAMVALAALGSGCRSTAVATQNLDSILGSSDRFRYQARTTTVFRDTMRNGVGSLGGILRREANEPPLRTVPNPSKVALRNLRDLASSTQGPRAWRHNEQVRLLTRYARSAPSQLCRERAVIELAAHALRLEITEPYVPPEDAAANAPELVIALDGLVDAVREVATDAADGQLSATSEADFAAAVELLRATRVDVQGGSRLLRLIGPFLRGGRLPSAQREALAGLSIEVQRDLVRESLWAAASDTSAVVRAAGMRTNIAVYGETFAVEALLALVPTELVGDALEARWSRFRIARVLPSLDEVYLAVLGSYADHGLPLAARLPNADSLDLRLTTFFILWVIAIDDRVFAGRVQNAAMRALGTVSGGDLSSLRAEEWDQWWRQLRPKLEAEMTALRASEGG